MTFWSSIAPRLLADDRAWVQAQEAGSWPQITERLGQLLAERIAEHTSEYFDRPDDWSVPYAELPEVQPQDPRLRRVSKVWGVLRYWWPIATEAWGAPQSAERVLLQLRSQRGFVRPAASGGPTKSPSLGGDPIADALFADAVTEQATKAILILERRYQELALQIARRKRITDPHWWPGCHSKIVTGRLLAGYRGEMGLDVFVGRILSREPAPRLVAQDVTHVTPSKRWELLMGLLEPERRRELEVELAAAEECDASEVPSLRAERKNRKVVRLLSSQESQAWDQSCDDQRAKQIHNQAPLDTSPDAIDPETRDCIRLWKEKTVAAFALLEPREVVAIYLREFASWSLEEASRLMGVVAGNVTRAVKRGLKRLYVELADGAKGDECLERVLTLHKLSELHLLPVDRAILKPGVLQLLEDGFRRMHAPNGGLDDE
jgi:DNA-directed RNA polymerase specialized sigma24 family protein